MATLKRIKFGELAHDIAKTVVNGTGVVSVTNTKDFSNEKTEDKDYSYDIDVNVDGSTIVKSENKLAVGNVPAAKVTVANGAGLTATDAQAAFKELKEKIDNVGGAAKSYTIVKVTEGLDSKVKEQYKLKETVGEKSNFVGAPIDIYKDSSLKDVKLVGQELVFTYILDNGTEKTVSVDISTFLAESEFKDGLQVTDHVVSVKIDPTSEKDSQAKPAAFLTVSADGIKISGIKDEIDRKIAALDVVGTVEAGKYVSSVSETNGIVSTTTANVSDAVLNGYAKGEKPASTAIAATDDVKGALAKLEHQVDAAKAAATTKVVKDNAASHLTLTSSTAADGSTTYTIGENDIASKAALDDEIAARKAVDGQDGQTYVANGKTNYISVATSLNDADVKLDAALKAEADRAKSAETSIDAAIGLTKGRDNETRTYTNTGEYIGKGVSNTVASDISALDTKLKEVADGLAAVQYQVNGTTLEFFGISLKTV